MREFDGITVGDYEQDLEANLLDLCTRVHTGRYRPQDRIEDEGNEMALGIVAFARFDIEIGAGGVEISQGDGGKRVSGIEIPKHPFGRG